MTIVADRTTRETSTWRWRECQGFVPVVGLSSHPRARVSPGGRLFACYLTHAAKCCAHVPRTDVDVFRFLVQIALGMKEKHNNNRMVLSLDILQNYATLTRLQLVKHHYCHQLIQIKLQISFRQSTHGISRHKRARVVMIFTQNSPPALLNYAIPHLHFFMQMNIFLETIARNSRNCALLRYILKGWEIRNLFISSDCCLKLLRVIFKYGTTYFTYSRSPIRKGATKQIQQVKTLIKRSPLFFSRLCTEYSVSWSETKSQSGRGIFGEIDTLTRSSR